MSYISVLYVLYISPLSWRHAQLAALIRSPSPEQLCPHSGKTCRQARTVRTAREAIARSRCWTRKSVNKSCAARGRRAVAALHAPHPCSPTPAPAIARAHLCPSRAAALGIVCQIVLVFHQIGNAFLSARRKLHVESRLPAPLLQRVLHGWCVGLAGCQMGLRYHRVCYERTPKPTRAVAGVQKSTLTQV